MLEEKKAWKREAGFDRTETTAEMDAERLRAGFDPQPFYTELYNPRWPHTPEEYTLEIIIDVERLKVEILLLQPSPPPQCDSPRRRSSLRDQMNPEYRELRVSQRRGKEFFLFQASVDGFLHVSCTRPEQECILLQPDVGLDDDKEKATNSEQAAAREKFARPSKKRQQQRITAWTTEQSKQFGPGGWQRNHYFSVKTIVLSCILFARHSCVFLYFSVLSASFQSRYERRGELSLKDGSDWGANQMRELLYQDRSAHHRIDLRQRREYSAQHCLCSPHNSTVVFRNSLHFVRDDR